MLWAGWLLREATLRVIRLRHCIELHMSLSLSCVRWITGQYSGTRQLLRDSRARRGNNLSEYFSDSLRSAVDLHSIDILDILSFLRHACCFKHLSEVRFRLCQLEFLALFLIVFNSNLLVLSHELPVYGIHGFRPHSGLSLLLLHVEVILIDLGLWGFFLLVPLNLWLIIVFNRFVCEDVKSTVELLLVPLHGNLVDLHSLVSFKLCHALFASLGLDVVAHFKPLSLVLVAEVFLV